MEMIGKVNLNLDLYPGEDFYSDGSIEDEILEFVKTYTPDEYDAFIEEKKDWAVLYHLSAIRQNIVSSLPISKEDSVLEIGSGCGAITGKLCEMGEKVTCVELSKRRSLINACRNREFSNLEIHVGNFEDIEKTIKVKYDWITLIGVYEYAAAYIHTRDPYHDFIRIAMRHLNPGGKLVIAIENRLGLKYFAGCKEDHVGLYFEGLEGYTNTEGIRTFSKPELIHILEECGCTNYEFLYPYPDYKFPLAIYSDDYLPKNGDLKMNFMNFDQVRQVLFDEEKVYNTLVDTELFPLFSNSFLVTITQRECGEADEQ